MSTKIRAAVLFAVLTSLAVVGAASAGCCGGPCCPGPCCGMFLT
jgi:hypothetical protein